MKFLRRSGQKGINTATSCPRTKKHPARRQAESAGAQTGFRAEAKNPPVSNDFPFPGPQKLLKEQHHYSDHGSRSRSCFKVKVKVKVKKKRLNGESMMMLPEQAPATHHNNRMC